MKPLCSVEAEQSSQHALYPTCKKTMRKGVTRSFIPWTYPEAGCLKMKGYHHEVGGEDDSPDGPDVEDPLHHLLDTALLEQSHQWGHPGHVYRDLSEKENMLRVSPYTNFGNSVIT